MSLRINVEDRISTYPGRVTLTPVDGETNTYDMARADVPITEGTPINKMLFDSKADAVSDDVVVYVATSGNDVSGDGTVSAPFATIQKAINEIPKMLDGHKVTIDIASGTYNERISVVGFSGGELIIGVSGRNVTVRGVEIVNCVSVETNITYITKTSGFGGPLYSVSGGSSVLIASAMQIDGNDESVIGMSATDGSSIFTAEGVTISVSYCYGVAVNADKCSFVSVGTIDGTDNLIGLTALRGGIVSYVTDNMTNMWGNNASSGGLVLTGTNSSDLSGATLDL